MTRECDNVCTKQMLGYAALIVRGVGEGCRGMDNVKSGR
jgi:hypothetical protein